MRKVRLTTGEELQVGKILCIGRNYAEHIAELGNEKPDSPVIFTKPSTSIILEGEEVVIPPYSSECHHEGEIAVLIGKTAKNISADSASEYIYGYGAAIDLTLRDVQAKLKAKGLPWDIAKGFDTAAPLSEFCPAGMVSDPADLKIRFYVNGELKQDGCSSMMIYPVSELIAYLSSIFTLERGDVILTGTPSGVGAIKSKDRLKAELVGYASVTVTVQ